MAFDRTNSTHLLALKNEVDNDPLSMGYAAVRDTTSALLELLNNPDNNLSPVNGNAPVTAEALLNAIFDESISSQDQFKIQLLFEATSGLTEDLSRYKTRVQSLSAGLNAALALIVRPLSRAEVLFSDDDANGIKEFVTISKADWFAARDS